MKKMLPRIVASIALAAALSAHSSAQAQTVVLYSSNNTETIETALKVAKKVAPSLNVQQVTEQSDTRAVFVMRDCRVQSARKRKGLPDFPCKSVGVVEYSEFARAIDPRLRTRCIACPPDPHGTDHWCAWEFTLDEHGPDAR